MYVLNKLKESHGTHLSTFIQVGPRVTKYWIEIVFEGAIKFYMKKSSQNLARGFTCDKYRESPVSAVFWSPANRTI